MKNLINRPSAYFRIEFWAATTIFILLAFFLISDALSFDWSMNNETTAPKTPFNYYLVSKLIRYSVLYGAFLLLNFKIVPMLVRRESIILNCLSVVIIFSLIGVIFAITNTYLKYAYSGSWADNSTHNVTFQNNLLYALWLLLVYGFYCLLKYFSLHLLTHSESIQAKYKFVTQEGIVVFTLWMMSMFILVMADADWQVRAIWGMTIPGAILFYWYSFYALIPKALTKKNPFRNYLLRTVLLLTLFYLPLFLIAVLLTQNPDAAAAFSFLNVVCQLLFTAPLCWILFKRQMKGNEEIYALKSELGRSNASFDFLRSQINPHFLFNALNTIYGTAIQEKAERTSEGIERLGDMMRFMLQENMQDKISLAREIDYLNNYITLQKLRTDTNPIIKIEAAIEQQVHAVQIAPMLLIPFVENAFKHGISLREPSHIKITLEVENNMLYFDVYNTKHEKPENDPEKNRSGIGLNNVKQRLQLLYPGKHELIIRDTKKDYFVHLTIQLK